jgi:hypothetical protein
VLEELESDSVDDPDLAGPSEPPPEDVPASAGLASAAEADRRLALRSFFAQPDPLKWIVGGANALRTWFEWQTGQVFGPSSWTP